MVRGERGRWGVKLSDGALGKKTVGVRVSDGEPANKTVEDGGTDGQTD